MESGFCLIFGWNFKSHLKALRHFKNKIPIYFRGDSTLLDERNQSYLRKTLRTIVLTWVYKHVDKAFFVGTNNKKYYEKHGLKPHQLIYLPHAIDNDRFGNFPNADMQGRMLRMKMAINAEDVVFLFAGKLQIKKNPQLLLNAFLKSDLRNARLLFVGNGDLENELKLVAEPYKNIHFLPFQK